MLPCFLLVLPGWGFRWKRKINKYITKHAKTATKFPIWLQSITKLFTKSCRVWLWGTAMDGHTCEVHKYLDSIHKGQSPPMCSPFLTRTGSLWIYACSDYWPTGTFNMHVMSVQAFVPCIDHVPHKIFSRMIGVTYVLIAHQFSQKEFNATLWMRKW